MAVMFVMKGMVKAWGGKGVEERLPFEPSSNFNFLSCRRWHASVIASVMCLDCFLHVTLQTLGIGVPSR